MWWELINLILKYNFISLNTCLHICVALAKFVFENVAAHDVPNNQVISALIQPVKLTGKSNPPATDTIYPRILLDPW